LTTTQNVRRAVLSLLSLSFLAAGFTLSPRAFQTVRHLAIQHNGRIKPLDTFARETLRFITGSARLGSENPVQTVLSIVAEPDRWQDRPLIAVPFVPLREKLGLSRTTQQVSYNQLVETRKLMRMLPAIVEKQGREEKLSMLEQETMDAYERFVALSGLFTQKLHLVPPPPSETSMGGMVWLPVLEATGYPQGQRQAIQTGWSAFLDSLRAGRAEEIEKSAQALVGILRSANPSAVPAPWRLDLELFYNDFSPFRVAQFFYLLAAAGLLFNAVSKGKRPRAGMIALLAGFLMHGAGIAMRVVLGGRPPVSNFYETMLWLPFVAVAISLVFERIYRVGYFGLASAILAVIVLVLSDYVPLEPYLSPVVAVLRSNLWLTIHVLTVVASYGALSLAVGLAHIYGWLYLVRGRRHPALRSLDLYLYRGLQVGVVLLAAGIMLGAVWANASWGRYWGWDPKETWALITLLWFLAVLHGRFAGWMKGVTVALATIAGFFLLLMTYYGVSFYLVGLHSYAGGHAKPIPPLLIAYLVAEVIFISLIGFDILRKRSFP